MGPRLARATLRPDLASESASIAILSEQSLNAQLDGRRAEDDGGMSSRGLVLGKMQRRCERAEDSSLKAKPVARDPAAFSVLANDEIIPSVAVLSGVVFRAAGRVAIVICRCLQEHVCFEPRIPLPRLR